MSRRKPGAAPRRAVWATRWESLRGFGSLRIVAAGLGGMAVYRGFAPSTWWWSPVVGFALLAIAVRGRGWRAAAGLGFVFGAAFFLPLLTWSGIYVGNVPWLALSLAEAALVAPATALMGPVSRRLPAWPVWAACLWVGGEHLRAVFPFGGFPWGGVAFTQADGPLLPVVTTVGESGLAFAVALTGLAAGELIHRVVGLMATRVRGAAFPDHSGARRAVGLTIAVALLPFAGGLLAAVADVGGGATLADTAASAKTVAVIQGNVPEPGLEFNARRRAVLDMHAAETARLADAVAAGRAPQPDLVIWPENSSDIDPYAHQDAAAVIDAAAQRIDAPVLVGAVITGPRPKTVYNKAIVWDPETGPGDTYTKRHPVPFGEYMPWRSFFRIFSDKVDLVRADFLPGSTPGNLTVGGANLGVVICFEVVEDGLVRDVVRGGADVIVVQTNNATFGYTNETYQQQAMSRIRAVEYRRPVIIAATSGVSAVIDAHGTVQDSVGLFSAGWMTTQVSPDTPSTPSTVLGAPIQWMLTAGGLVAFGMGSVLARRSQGDSADAVQEDAIDG